MTSLGAVVRVTDNLLAAMQSDSFRNMFSPPQLEEFQMTVTYFRKWLVDAEPKVEHQPTIDKGWFPVVRLAIYQIDDLVDELLTQGHLGRRGRYQRPFFQKMRWMDQLKMELEKVVIDHHHVSKVGFEPIGVQRYKTLSNAEDIVGREDEVQAVLQVLLHSSDVLAIVGLGGIGKSTLAKLSFNHLTIQIEFPLRFWVRVSKFGEPFHVKDVLSDILDLARKCGLSVPSGSLPLPSGGLSIEVMGIQLREMIGENKFLLVLDDVWNVDPQEWLLFRDILTKGGEGSRILVTTRSQETAQIVSGSIPYELKGLSQPNSWRLFQRIALPNRDNKYPPRPDLVEQAKQIIHKFYGHPHAIKEAATILSELGIKSFHEHGLARFIQTSETLSSLKLSYYDLGFSLKSCFSYCALFPVESVIHKRMLISLWMAQGYIMSFKEDQSIEAVGDECFSVLFENGFFEVVEKDEWGEIVTCKMHGLMHSVAKKVAGEEFCEASSTSYDTVNSASHLFQSGELPAGNSLFTKTKIRSYLRDACNQLPVDALIRQWRSLRTLDLHCLDIKSLPDSIGGLIHLRYLDLSHNIYLDALPEAIVKLQNLQTLDLRFCALLKELPQELSRLSALRCLDMFGCDGLIRMPPGMEKLTCLQLLSLFVVAEGIPGVDIRDLTKLVNLRGSICISIPRSYTHVKRIDWRGGCLEEHKHLQEVRVRFLESHSVDNSDQRIINYHQVVLEKLQPHGNIKKLVLWGYQGATIAKWGRAEDNWADTLPSLVKIELTSCEKLKRLPKLSNLPHLKSLKLHGLRELEYLEEADISSSTQVPRAFFPSLEELEIVNAPKLRGLWDSNTSSNCASFPPNLVNIELRSCEMLQQLPLLSNLLILKSLKLYGLSSLESLGKIFSSTTSSMPEPEKTFLPSLEKFEIVDAPKLRGCVTAMELTDDSNKASPETSCFRSLNSLVLANLPELREFYCLESGDDSKERKPSGHTYTLQFGCLSELRVSNCPKLKSMPLVPTIDVLEVINIHVDLLKHLVGNQEFQASSSSSTLRKVDIVAVHELHYLQVSLSNVESLTLRQCELWDTLALGSSAYVKKLTIQDCGRLKHVLPVLNHLSCLEELEVADCEELDWNINDDGGSVIAWQSLKSLRSL